MERSRSCPWWVGRISWKATKAEVAEWQTRRIQNPVPARVCGFNSHLRHLEWWFALLAFRLRPSDAAATRSIMQVNSELLYGVLGLRDQTIEGIVRKEADAFHAAPKSNEIVGQGIKRFVDARCLLARQFPYHGHPPTARHNSKWRAVEIRRQIRPFWAATPHSAPIRELAACGLFPGK